MRDADLVAHELALLRLVLACADALAGMPRAIAARQDDSRAARRALRHEKREAR